MIGHYRNHTQVVSKFSNIKCYFLILSFFSFSADAMAQAIGEPFRISANQVLFGDVNNFQISADGSRVVYAADQNTDGVNEIFSVPITGGSPVRLNGNLVTTMLVAPMGLGWCCADQNTDNVFKSAQPDGSRVVYRWQIKTPIM